MANDKFDGDLPNIVLDKEDREAFQRTRAKELGKGTSNKTTEPEAVTHGKISKLAIFAFLIGLGACGGIYYLHQLTVEQNAALISAQNRIADLEGRLSATGEEMDQSAGAMRVKVSELSDKTDELWEQMDKLWASAWRKNQADISALSETVTRKDNVLDKKLGVIESDTASVSTNLAVLQEKLSAQSNSVEQLNGVISALQKNDNDLKRQVGDVQAKIISLEQINSAITRRVAELEKWKRSVPAAGPSAPDVP